jgi:hypothetical protein
VFKALAHSLPEAPKALSGIALSPRGGQFLAFAWSAPQAVLRVGVRYIDDAVIAVAVPARHSRFLRHE